MNARDLLRLVWSNLRRMKTRVIMTAIGVVIGTAAVVVLVSLAAGLQRSAARDLGSIGDLTKITVLPTTYFGPFGASGRRGNEPVLDNQTLAEFRELPGVVAATPYEWLQVGAMLRLNRLVGGASIVGIDPTQVEHLGFTLASGMMRLGPGQALVGARVAENFYDARTGRPVGPAMGGGEVVVVGPVAGRPVEKPPNLQGQSLQLVLNKPGEDGRMVERVVRVRVTGVLAEAGGQDDYTVFLALSDVIELNGWASGRRPNPGRDGYSQAIVKVASTNQVLAVEQEILRQGFYAYSPRSMLQSMNVFFLVIQGIFGGIGAIALIVAAFGIANTMTMAIYERTREIGLMKAVGASNRDVMSIFLAEAGGIGFLGGVTGVALGVVLGALIDLVASTYLAAQAVQSGASAADVNISLIYTPLWLPVFAVLFASLVGVASGIYPAMRAASLNPVAALKYE